MATKTKARPAAKSSDADLDRRSMIITRVLSAPCEKAFEAWTKPEVLSRWFGPNGFSITTSKHEFREGGAWRFVMHGPDGTDYDNIIRYDEIVRPKRIAYRHGDPSSDGSRDFQTTITFEPLGVRTLITLRAVFANQQIRDKVLAEVNAIEGGQQTLARLDAVVSASTAEPKVKPFEISRVFSAPREIVFAAMTEPKRMSEWLSPKGMIVVKQAMDMRPGGTYHYGLETATGQQMWGKFFYLEITPPSRLAYINVFSDADGGITCHPTSPDWPREMLSLTTLEDQGGKTLMTLRWEPLNAGEAELAVFNGAHDGMRGGWTGTMDQLDAYLASTQSEPSKGPSAMALKTSKPVKTSKPAKSKSVAPFTITRTFNAPRAAVVKAWTDEKELMKWWGPKGGKMLSAKMDLRPGGIFHYSMQSTDFKMWGKWIIKEVDLPNKLVWLNCFSDPRGGTVSHAMMPEFPKELHTTVTFTEKGGKTTVKVVWDPKDCSETEQKAFDSIRESMNQGWGGSLDVLGEVLAKPTNTPQTIIPHLTVKDTIKAIAFYKKVYGAKEVQRTPAQDGKRILHCVMAINGASFFLSDEFPEFGGPGAPSPANRSPVAVAINLASPAELDKTYAAALKAGAKEGLAPHDSFWGARFAMLTDPSGHRWMLNAELTKA